MNDILPPMTGRWRRIEDVLRDVAQSYGYEEIRVPLLEQTELFRRSIGEVTDIVEKEMYTFDDRNGESLTLRPEATAGIVRAGITNGLLYNQRQKLWTSGPMFRREKPQQGARGAGAPSAFRASPSRSIRSGRPRRAHVTGTPWSTTSPA